MNNFSVIKSESDNPYLIWKHPARDFISGSQLIVNPSEEAIFRNNGIDDGPYTEGVYSLTSDNMPGLRKFFKHTENGVSPFHCEVYFVKITQQMGVKWGTDSKVIYIDEANKGHQWEIGAHGELSIKVSNSRKLLEKLVGNSEGMACRSLMEYFRAPIMTAIKTYLPTVLRDRGISIFEVDRYLSVFSDDMRISLTRELEDYGVSLEKFWITEILKPENDPAYQKMRELTGRNMTIDMEQDVRTKEARMEQNIDLIKKETEVQKDYMQKRMEYTAEKERQKELGYTYSEARQFDVMEKMAENEGTGSDMRNAFTGLGMGLGMGGPIGGAFANIATNTMSFDNRFSANIGAGQTPGNVEAPADDGEYCFCSNCGNRIKKTDKFCSECGEKRGV